jgi:cysteine desulfurase / selenocysteine lyase
LKPGDEVLITHMEHHSNIVPWQMACQATGATLRIIPIDDNGALAMDEFDAMLSEKTKLVGVVHQSNSLGTVNPVAEIAKKAHAVGALVLADGAQAMSHQKVDVQALDVDFYAMSAHKAYGPTGIGALYGKRAILEKLPPWQGGGDMILSVTFERTVYNKLPYYFEAGTPDIAGPIGWAAAIDWMDAIGLDVIAAHEADVLRYGAAKLSELPHLRMIGTAPHKSSILAFVHDHAHPHDIGTILDREGVAIRTGHHCTQPVMARFGVPATARASLAVYNTRADIDRLIAALQKVNEVFG